MVSWSYLISARFEWKPNDPEIVSDVLFAVANVLSIARTTYLMPAFEVLGPLQISLGRMIGDITRFLVLFALVSNPDVIMTGLPEMSIASRDSPKTFANESVWDVYTLLSKVTDEINY